MFFFPHMYIPRYMFLLNPYAALQAAVVWIFSKFFGEDDVDILKARISVSAFELLKPFEIFWEITLSFWTEGYPKNVHQFLGPNFNESVILSGIENIHLNSDFGGVFNNANPGFEIFAKNTGLKIDFNAQKDTFNFIKPTRVNLMTNNALFRGCFCFNCSLETPNQEQTKKTWLKYVYH
jgi:hypothetical protein